MEQFILPLFDRIAEISPVSAITFIFILLFAYHSNKQLKIYRDIMHKDSINIMLAVGKTTLTDSQTLDITSYTIWYASREKLEYIQRRLELNNINTRANEIKVGVRAELVKLTKESVAKLNEFNSTILNLGDWLWENFDFEPFLEDVYKIILRKDNDDLDKKTNIHLKIRDISDIMKKYQNKMMDKMRRELAARNV